MSEMCERFKLYVCTMYYRYVLVDTLHSIVLRRVGFAGELPLYLRQRRQLVSGVGERFKLYL